MIYCQIIFGMCSRKGPRLKDAEVKRYRETVLIIKIKESKLSKCPICPDLQPVLNDRSCK